MVAPLLPAPYRGAQLWLKEEHEDIEKLDCVNLGVRVDNRHFDQWAGSEC